MISAFFFFVFLIEVNPFFILCILRRNFEREFSSEGKVLHLLHSSNESFSTELDCILESCLLLLRILNDVDNKRDKVKGENRLDGHETFLDISWHSFSLKTVTVETVAASLCLRNPFSLHVSSSSSSPCKTKNYPSLNTDLISRNKTCLIDFPPLSLSLHFLEGSSNKRRQHNW